VGDVTGIGDGTRVDATARSRWRRPRTWLGVLVLLAAAVVIGVNVPFMLSGPLEAKRLLRDGVVVSGVIWQREKTGKYGYDVLVSYEYEGRLYESWVDCGSSSSGCELTDVLELWVDPQRPDRFATRGRAINYGVGSLHWRKVLVYTFGGLALFVVINFLRSVSEDPARQARYRQARRRTS
jgi:hypothetical protein